MNGWNESDYVKELRRKELEKIEREERLCNFRQKFKKQIEDGLTEQKFKQSYHSEDDLKLFRQVKQEVEWEEKQGAAFLFGFQNPSAVNGMKNNKLD